MLLLSVAVFALCASAAAQRSHVRRGNSTGAWSSAQCGLSGSNPLGFYPSELKGNATNNTLIETSFLFTLHNSPSAQHGGYQLFSDPPNGQLTGYTQSVNGSVGSWYFLTFTPDARYSSLLAVSGTSGTNDIAIVLEDTLTATNKIELFRSRIVNTVADYGSTGFYLDNLDTLGVNLRFMGYGVPVSFLSCTNQTIGGVSVPGEALYYKWANVTAPPGCKDVSFQTYYSCPGGL